MIADSIKILQRSLRVRPICLAAILMAAPSIAHAQSIVMSEPTDVTLSSSSDESGRISLTAAVITSAGNGVPGGSIQFIDETSRMVLGSTSAAQPTIIVDRLDAGPHRIRADYTGTSDFLPLVVQPSHSAALTINIKGAPNVTLSSSDNPSDPGQLVTLTAIVACPDARPNGAVTFRDGGHVLASHVGLDRAGHASFTTSALPDGARVITVEYEGDSAHARTTSPRLVQDVGSVVRIRSSQLDR